ncbi:hypothetical protein DFS33DRAFT_1345920 [Desarmillaria ectypa]|nr:hypothetical protein DFS33DRAFT_1345920 [Desarmillaria ectypa]
MLLWLANIHWLALSLPSHQKRRPFPGNREPTEEEDRNPDDHLLYESSDVIATLSRTAKSNFRDSLGCAKRH